MLINFSGSLDRKQNKKYENRKSFRQIKRKQQIVKKSENKKKERDKVMKSLPSKPFIIVYPPTFMVEGENKTISERSGKKG